VLRYPYTRLDGVLEVVATAVPVLTSLTSLASTTSAVAGSRLQQLQHSPQHPCVHRDHTEYSSGKQIDSSVEIAPLSQMITNACVPENCLHH
jgi:hypothetical protein